jgi:hypothetical protein
MIKNVALAILGVALVLSFGMRNINRNCPKEIKTPYMDNGCVIQSTPTGNVKTCG